MEVGLVSRHSSERERTRLRDDVQISDQELDDIKNLSEISTYEDDATIRHKQLYEETECLKGNLYRSEDDTRRRRSDDQPSSIKVRPLEVCVISWTCTDRANRQMVLCGLASC